MSTRIQLNERAMLHESGGNLNASNIRRVMKDLPRYSEELGRNTDYFKAWNSLTVVLRDPEKAKKALIPGALYPSSAGDKYPCVAQILDNEKGQELVAALRKMGWAELNNYRCAQWGTWKYELTSLAWLKALLKVASTIY